MLDDEGNGIIIVRKLLRCGGYILFHMESQSRFLWIAHSSSISPRV
jgi:hypothetical protein